MISDRHPERIPVPIPAEDLSYIAGIIDGEGYVGISKTTSGYYCSTVSIAMTNPSSLIFIQQRFGGKITSRRSKNANAKPHQRLRYVGRYANSIIEKVKPYLLVKSKQSDLILELAILHKQSKINREPTNRSKKSSEYFEKEKLLYEKCKELNERGIFAHQRDILRELEDLWTESSYLRLGQLLVNALSTDGAGADLFYIEDKDLVNKVREFKKRMDNGNSY
jgi:hypothetical protein